jgi:hypothetical protein
MMFLGWSISGVLEVVRAFVWGEGPEDVADGDTNGINVANCGVAQQVLELFEDLFDRVQVREYFGRKNSLASGANEPAHSFTSVAAEIVS